MSTLVVYADIGDGQLDSYDVSKGVAQAGSGYGASGYLQVGETNPVRVEAWNTYDNYYDDGTYGYLFTEVFEAFDTSVLGGGATVSAATLSLYGAGAAGTQDDTIEVRPFDWGGSLGTEDWVPASTFAGLSLLGSFAATTANWTAAYHDLTSGNFPAAINKVGSTRLVISGLDLRLGITVTHGGCYFYFYSADQAGTTYDPKLTVTYTLPLPVFSSPATATNQTPGTPIVWSSNVATLRAHFNLQLATDSGFTNNVLNLYSYSDPGFEYWDGSAWQPLGQAGMPANKTGNNVRYTNTSALRSGGVNVFRSTIYRKVRQTV